MPVTVQSFWNDSGLKAAVKRAGYLAASDVAKVMEATKPAHSIKVRGPISTMGSKVFVVKAGGLAPIFEKGAEPHVIAPGASSILRTSYSKKKGATSRTGSKRGGKSFLFLKGPNVFVSGPVQHPGMRAQPFMGPAARKFPTFFNLRGRSTLPQRFV